MDDSVNEIVPGANAASSQRFQLHMYGGGRVRLCQILTMVLSPIGQHVPAHML